MVDRLYVTKTFPDLCTLVVGNAIVNVTLSCNKEFKGNLHLSLKKEILPSCKLDLACCWCFSNCTAMGNVIASHEVSIQVAHDH